jgi:glycosyltransferase involved in cell wall biosynthesis
VSDATSLQHRSGTGSQIQKAITVAIFTTHIAPALGYGGVSVVAAALTEAWARRKVRLRLCASNESVGGALRPEDVKLGDNVEVSLYRCYGFRRWGFGWGAIPLIWSMCRHAEAAYIHGVATWPCTLAAIFCSVLRRHFVVAPRGGLMAEHVALIRREKFHKWMYYKLLTFPSLRRAATIHCTSRKEAQGVKALLGPDANTAIIPNGIDSDNIEVREPPGFAGNRLCFLGHIQPEKGINAFVRVWLKHRRPGDQLIVAGRSVDGAYFKTFVRLVEESNDAIIYKGYIDRAGILEVLGESHFLVLPSGLEEGGMRENFGNVVAEALAAGRPALVVKGLAWDAIESAGAGFVFDRSEESLATVLARIQSLDREQWNHMSAKARQYAQQNLDLNQLADHVWSLLVARTQQAEIK